jgi:hypothetical protein
MATQDEYTHPEFQKWYLNELKRQNCTASQYDLPDAYSDWLENFPNRKPPSRLKTWPQ